MKKRLLQVLATTLALALLCGCKPAASTASSAPADPVSEAASSAAATATDTQALLSYTVTVTDADGAPVPGVMLQICDESTCVVLPTDDKGMVAFERTPYAYEVHLLSTPAGFAQDTTVHHVSESGGNLDIVLQAE